MADGTAFCTKCGAKMAAPVATAGGAAAAPAGPIKIEPKSSGLGLKIILITFGAIAFLGIAGIATVGFLAKRYADTAVKTDASGKVTSVSIGGTKIETLKDSRLVAQNLGVEVYPDATADDQSASSMTIGGVTTTHAQFTSDASIDDVFNFYKEKYPNANVAENDNDKTPDAGLGR
jgi:hypothetical protein